MRCKTLLSKQHCFVSETETQKNSKYLQHRRYYYLRIDPDFIGCDKLSVPSDKAGCIASTHNVAFTARGGPGLTKGAADPACVRVAVKRVGVCGARGTKSCGTPRPRVVSAGI